MLEMIAKNDKVDKKFVRKRFRFMNEVQQHPESKVIFQLVFSLFIK